MRPKEALEQVLDSTAKAYFETFKSYPSKVTIKRILVEKLDKAKEEFLTQSIGSIKNEEALLILELLNSDGVAHGHLATKEVKEVHGKDKEGIQPNRGGEGGVSPADEGRTRGRPRKPKVQLQPS